MTINKQYLTNIYYICSISYDDGIPTKHFVETETEPNDGKDSTSKVDPARNSSIWSPDHVVTVFEDPTILRLKTITGTHFEC